MKKDKKDKKKQKRRKEHHLFALAKTWELFEEAKDAMDEDDSSLAIRLLIQATKTDPNFIPAYLYLGYLYNKEQEPDLALRFLWEAQRKDPQNPVVYHYLSDSYFFLDRLDEVDDCCQKIISLFKGKRNLSPPEKK